ncbi:DMT family transporter [Candidatus Uhrbacteria bacterium]|nr:DMT family transporter [Candidatus Uhrbacteria bacterium]
MSFLRKSFLSRGASALFAVSLIYGVSAIIYRLIGLEFGVFYTTLTRNIIMFAIACMIVLALKQWLPILSGDIRWFALLGAAGALANATFFLALNLLPIGTALFFFYACATIASFAYGILFFAERTTPHAYVGLILGISGLIVLFSETVRYAPILFIVIACLAGILEATWNIFSKKISSRYPLAQILAIDAAIAAIISLAIVLLTGEKILPPSFTTSWIAIFASSITVLAGSYLIIFGYRYMEAHRGSIILLLEVVFGSIFAFLLFNESLSSYTIAGGLLIGAGVIVMNYNNRP